jgi:hypothetical protein
MVSVNTTITIATTMPDNVLCKDAKTRIIRDIRRPKNVFVKRIKAYGCIYRRIIATVKIINSN